LTFTICCVIIKTGNKKAPRREYQNWRSDTPHNQKDDPNI